jgi:hypothetical protein
MQNLLLSPATLTRRESIVQGAGIESLRVVFPAACGEFVISAEAGIKKTRLDSASSAEWQNLKFLIPRCLWRGSSLVPLQEENVSPHLGISGLPIHHLTFPGYRLDS